MRMFFLSFLVWMALAAQAQQATVRIVDSGTRTSLRGLSVVSDRVVWASGSNGKVARSTNGGATWQWHTVPGFEKREFRDIEAFDSLQAVMIAIAEPAQIVRTADGGQTWQVVFTDSAKGMFLDAMDFRGRKGLVVGDPVNGRFYIARTKDGGQTWQPETVDQRPAAATGEACFAASGTNIHLLNNGSYYLVSGGLQSRLFRNGRAYPLPVMQGAETKGANGLLADGKQLWIAGGDFSRPDVQDSTVLVLEAKPPFALQHRVPLPYCSAIARSGGYLLACGIRGIYLLAGNAPYTPQQLNAQAFHTVKVSPDGKTVFFAGNNGRIARLVTGAR